MSYDPDYREDCIVEMDNGDYVLHSEAQAEIARLQAEVERLTYDLEWMTTDRGKWQDSATRRLFERDAARNDAIEAAAMVQVLRINEGGQRYMSGLSPEARAAIRALKITTQDQSK